MHSVEDKLIFGSTVSGELTFSDAYNTIRQPSFPVSQYKQIWNKFMPP